MSVANKNAEGLIRVIGVPGLTLGIVNGIIGAGIFALPAIVSIDLGAFGVYGYVFCAIMMAAIMLCYAEVGTRVTTSGGSYAYVEAAFGRFSAYLVNWLYFFGFGVLGSAALMNIIADSLAVLFPIFLDPFIRGVSFLILIGIMLLLNVLGAKQGIGLVKLITLFKLLPLFAIILFGFSHISTSHLQWEHLPSLKTFGSATLVLFFAFAGFETTLGASGELKDPRRTIPLALLLGGVFVLIIYLLLQTVVQGVLGEEVVSFKNAPLAAVAERIIGPVGATILLFTAALSCFGSVCSDILATPRLLFAASRDRLFPKFLGIVHPRFSTPYLAVITYASLIFIFSISGGFKQLAVLASAAILLVYLAVILSTMRLRQIRKAEDERSFSMPGGLIAPFIGTATIIWLLFNLTRWEILSTLIFLAVVSGIYFITRKTSFATKPLS